MIEFAEQIFYMILSIFEGRNGGETPPSFTMMVNLSESCF